MSQPSDKEREKGLEKRPNRVPNIFRGSLRWATAVFAGLTALACAQTVEVPSILVRPISEAPVTGIIPDLLVTFRDPSNIQEVQVACPEETVFFETRNLAYWGSDSEMKLAEKDSFGPNGNLGPAVVTGSLMSDNGRKPWFHISQPTIDVGVYEGPQRLDCFGVDNILLETKKGRYRMTVKS